MTGDVIYGLRNNKTELALIAAAAAITFPKAAGKIGEIAIRVGYVYVAEQVRSGSAAAKAMYEVLTRKPGAARPPIVPASDKAALRAIATRGLGAARGVGSRVAVRGITIVASPTLAVTAAGLGAGLLVSHGIGQLPDVQKTATIGQQFVLGAPV